MAALQKLVNLFRGSGDEWTVEKSGKEQTLSRPIVDMNGHDTNQRHTFQEYKNSVRNPESRGVFDDKKAPFTEIIATERNTSLAQQRQRIRDELLIDCGGSKLYKKPVGVLSMHTDPSMNLVGDCDVGNGRVHKGELNEFNTCGSKDVYNSFGLIVGAHENKSANCLITTGVAGKDAHFRTILGSQRDNGESHMVLEDRATAPTLVEFREGEVYGDTMTQFHHLDGQRDERLCARYGYFCGYQK